MQGEPNPRSGYCPLPCLGPALEQYPFPGLGSIPGPCLTPGHYPAPETRPPTGLVETAAQPRAAESQYMGPSAGPIGNGKRKSGGLEALRRVADSVKKSKSESQSTNVDPSLQATPASRGHRPNSRPSTRLANGNPTSRSAPVNGSIPPPAAPVPPNRPEMTAPESTVNVPADGSAGVPDQENRDESERGPEGRPDAEDERSCLVVLDEGYDVEYLEPMMRNNRLRRVSNPRVRQDARFVLVWQSTRNHKLWPLDVGDGMMRWRPVLGDLLISQGERPPSRAQRGQPIGAMSREDAILAMWEWMRLDGRPPVAS
ncbi:hypothetical protein F4777DRAFT_583617 [Nemania sp. FL0916]|nr:hypothetical protein F4777DRAFT_583617 [Nemania sp. FL0916]